MEDKKGFFPAEGPGYFEGFLENIKKSTVPKDDLFWTIVNQFGNELGQSIEQNKVNDKEAEKFRRGIEEFMQQGNNMEKYKMSSKVTTTFWWVKKQEEEAK